MEEEPPKQNAIDVNEVTLEDCDDDVILEGDAGQDTKTGLKKRRGGDVAAPVEEKEGLNANPEKLAMGFLKRLEKSKFVPQAVKPYVRKLETAVPVMGKALKVISPLLEKGWDLGVKAYGVYKKKKLERYLPLVAGLVLIMYGGTFMFLIAAVEAYRVTGWERTAKCFADIRANYVRVKKADEEDDRRLARDDDGDGRTLEEEMDDEEYLYHKASMVLKVVEPQQLMDALSGISAGFFAVIATLKAKFAESVTLGICLGKMFEKAIKGVFLKEVQSIMGRYRKWADPMITYLCRFIGISIAYTLQRVIFSFYSAVRGADIFLAALAVTLAWKADVETSININAIKLGLGILGFVKQLYTGYGVFFPLNILLAPAFIADWFIGVFVALS